MYKKRAYPLIMFCEQTQRVTDGHKRIRSMRFSMYVTLIGFVRIANIQTLFHTTKFFTLFV